MRLHALLLARGIVVFALFPALAGCLVEEERLDRADDPVAPEPATPRPVPWATREEATIYPGVLLRTELRDCPTHFLFTRPDNNALFLGTTAYCARDLPLGALATVGEEADIAILIYNSFETMAERGEDDPDALEYNDLAIFHLDSSSQRRAHPATGADGPRALADGGDVRVGDRLRAFTPGDHVPAALAWREGIVGGHAGDWALLTYALPPGAPGSLGGPVLDTRGNAVGVLVTLGVFPDPGANGVARLDTMLAYARDHAGLPMDLATVDDAPMESSKS